MDLLQALNVTIYGLGIVFLALLVLMVAIMLLTKVFSMATGRELLKAPVAAVPRAAPRPAVEAAPAAAAPAAGPAEAIEAVPAPLPGKILSVAVKAGDLVKAGDELCVIEALKMANSVKSPHAGIVREVQVGAGDSVGFGGTLVLLAVAGAAPSAARPVPRPAAAPAGPAAAGTPVSGSLTLDVAGARHTVDLRGEAVVVDGASFQVRQDPGDRKTVFINGRAHTVEVRTRTAGGAVVVVDGVEQRIDVASQTLAAPVALVLTAGGSRHRVEVRASNQGDGSVSVDGAAFEVKRDPALRSKVLVNGKPHTVEVKERTDTGATVWIDGQLQQVAITGEPAAAPVAPARAAAPSAPARAAAPSGGEPVTAPLPGKILSVTVKPGDRVKSGDELCVIEALKMANSIKAQRDGTVRDVLVSPGQSVSFGAPLITLG